MTAAKRVFLTGVSALTASGATAQETWDSILAGRDGIEEIKHWDISSWTNRLGGELKNFQPAGSLPDRKLLKVISRQDVMGINAAMQAVVDSGLLEYRDSCSNPEAYNEQTAVYVGSPGNKYYQQYDFLPLIAQSGDDMQKFAAGLFEEVHPMWLLRILPNNVLAYTGIQYGFKGANHNITNHASGGMQALIEAYHAIQSGLAERALVVAYDVGTEPQAMYYYDKLGLISGRHLKPFDHYRDGTILAEGAAAILLESEQSVTERQAHCYAELLGGKSATEGSGLFSIGNEGAELADLLNSAILSAGLKALDIGMVVAHGNGNVKSDKTEAMAIQSVFADYQVPVTAFKWSMGHTICAAGPVDAVLTSFALAQKTVPAIANLENVSSDCSMLNVCQKMQALDAQKPHALIINRGFAGMNTCLVMKACD